MLTRNVLYLFSASFSQCSYPCPPCLALPCTALPCTALPRPALPCLALPCPALHCSAPPRPARPAALRPVSLSGGRLAKHEHSGLSSVLSADVFFSFYCSSSSSSISISRSYLLYLLSLTKEPACVDTPRGKIRFRSSETSNERYIKLSACRGTTNEVTPEPCR